MKSIFDIHSSNLISLLSGNVWLPFRGQRDLVFMVNFSDYEEFIMSMVSRGYTPYQFKAEHYNKGLTNRSFFLRLFYSDMANAMMNEIIVSSSRGNGHVTTILPTFEKNEIAVEHVNIRDVQCKLHHFTIDEQKNGFDLLINRALIPAMPTMSESGKNLYYCALYLAFMAMSSNFCKISVTVENE